MDALPADRKGPLGRLLARLPNPLDWNSTDKCLLLSSIAMASIVAYSVAGRYLLSHQVSDPIFNREFLRRVYGLSPYALAFTVALTLAALWLRRRGAESRLLVHLNIQFFSVGNAFMLWMLGLVTSPLVGVGFVGATFVGLMLFDLGPVLVSALSSLAVYIGATLAERAGLIAYAPLLAIEPWVDGRPPDRWVASMGGLSLAVALAVVAASIYVVHQFREQRARLEALSQTDSLTGLANRRHFAQRLDAELARARRLERPVALLLCDADHFKRVNDTYGHPAGDEVLRGLASILEENVRADLDVPARVGGEEFAVLLPETDLPGARRVAERIVGAMGHLRFNHDGREFHVTLSIGATSLEGDELDPDVLLEAADSLLYRAKRDGRNRVETASLDELAASA